MRWSWLVFVVGCSADLPAGWEDATPVDALVQHKCDGSPYDDEKHDERVASDLTGDPLEVQVFEAHFRCAQDVEAFFTRDGDQLDVLVQPIDMDPAAVAACDCLYDLDIEVTTTDEPPTSVTVFRRWDNLNDANDPVEIGSIVLGPKGPVAR